MKEYAKRTCVECGVRDIQPNMHEVVIEKEVGKSESGLSLRTMAGVALGDKASKRAVKRKIFNSSKRTYHAKRKAWVCHSCYQGEEQADSTVDSEPSPDDQYQANPLLFFKWLALIATGTVFIYLPIMIFVKKEKRNKVFIYTMIALFILGTILNLAEESSTPPLEESPQGISTAP